MRSNRWSSLQRRLPLSVSLLILGVVIGVTWLAYREQRRVLLRSAETHLRVAAAQLNNSLEQSVRSGVRGTQALAALPALRALAADEANPSASVVDAKAFAIVRDTLRKSMVSSREVSGFELRSRTGERVLIVGRAVEDSQRIATQLSQQAGELDTSAGPFAGSDTLVFYTMINALPDSAGWLITYTRVTNPESATLLASVIGRDVVFLLGSRSTGLWTNLERVVDAPRAVKGRADGSFGDYRWETPGLLRGVMQRVPGTSWEIWVGQPYDAVVAPARGFTRRMLMLGTVVLVVGWLIAIVMSRRLMRPITELTAAAEELSHGGHSHRLPARGDNEISEMAQSFNRMADHIAASRHELEDRVEARTAELTRALADLHAAQDLLVRKERLAILGQLASGVGHELRNPLGVMLNATYYLKYVLKDASPDVHEYIGILQGQIGLAEKIVSDLLDYARVKPPMREHVKLQQLIEAQLTRVGALDNIELVRDYDGAEPEAVIDRVHIGQVVFNLLTNAVQAMPDGGRLTVRTFSRDGLVGLEVGDTGGGVAPENLERIFEPLFTTKARGIGLGLAVSRGLAQANQGTLTVRNSDGGAVFTVTLPDIAAVVA